MLREIFELLNSQDFYVSDEYIDFAKGKYDMPTTWKKLKNTLIRYGK